MDSTDKLSKSINMRRLDYRITRFPKKRVLMITRQYGEVGGVGTVVRKLTDSLLKQGLYDVDILEKAGVDKPYSLLRYKKDVFVRDIFENVEQLLKTLGSTTYTVVHVHGLSLSDVYEGNIKKIQAHLEAPFVYTAHSLVRDELNEKHKKSLRKLEKLQILAQEQMFKISDRIIHLTIKGKENFDKYYPQYIGKGVIIPNGVQITYGDTFSKKKSEKTMLYVGRLSPEKGIQELAQAFSRINKKNPTIKLVIVGDDPTQKETIKKWLGDASDKVEWKWCLGEKDLREEYLRSDFVVIPSHTESFSLVALEAMNHKKPVLISDVGGPHELFIKQGMGIPLKPFDVESIVCAVDYVINPKNRNSVNLMIEKAYKILKRKYECGAIAKKIAVLYDSLKN